MHNQSALGCAAIAPTSSNLTRIIKLRFPTLNNLVEAQPATLIVCGAPRVAPRRALERGLVVLHFDVHKNARRSGGAAGLTRLSRLSADLFGAARVDCTAAPYPPRSLLTCAHKDASTSCGRRARRAATRKRASAHLHATCRCVSGE